jgi:site-specific recombinase XerD
MKALLGQARREYSAGQSNGSEAGTSSGEAVAAASARYRPLRNLALVDLLFATGMRVGEVSALDIRDFLIEEGVFRVQGKGGRDRLAFIVDEETVRVQREHLEARRGIATESPALFLNNSGARLSTQGIANVISRLRREAVIKRHITPHMLRHTVARADADTLSCCAMERIFGWSRSSWGTPRS